MALAPLLGEGPSWGIVDRDGRSDTVSIRADGSLRAGARPLVPIPTDPGMPEDFTGVPVAIAHAAGTSSAHQFALMSFAGRTSTRSFGVPTRGVPTADARRSVRGRSLSGRRRAPRRHARRKGPPR